MDDGLRQPDVVDVLTSEHGRVLELIDEILLTTEPERIRDLTGVLVAEVVRHQAVEESLVYPAMREHLAGSDDVVEHNLGEHREIDRTLKELDSADPVGPEFLACLRRLERELIHHAATQEAQQFPYVRRSVPGDVLVAMADDAEHVRASAGTRAHPGMPSGGLVDRLAGPGVRVVDRVRDRLADRVTDPGDLDPMG